MKIEQQTGFPADVGIAMSAFESGWWKSPSGDNNVFGMTRGSWPRERCKFCWTTEFVSRDQLLKFPEDERKTAVMTAPQSSSGRSDQKLWWRMQRWFRNYQSLEAAVEDYVYNIMNQEKLKTAWLLWEDSTKSLSAMEYLISNLSTAGYSSANASKEEIKILRQSNVREAVTLAKSDLKIEKRIINARNDTSV